MSVTIARFFHISNSGARHMIRNVFLFIVLALSAAAQKVIVVQATGALTPNVSGRLQGGTTLTINHTMGATLAAAAVPYCFNTSTNAPVNFATFVPSATTFVFTFGGSQTDTTCNVNASGTGQKGSDGATGPAGPAGSGGSGSPAGSNGDPQCNSSGSFGVCSYVGTGNLVKDTAPALVTPSLGVATATSINGTVIPSNATLHTAAGNNSFTGANDFSTGRIKYPVATFATPPSSPVTYQVFLFTDASAAGVCSGGGSAFSHCAWNGSAWTPLGGSGSGSGLPAGGTVGYVVRNTGPGTGTWQPDWTGGPSGSIVFDALNRIADVDFTGFNATAITRSARTNFVGPTKVPNGSGAPSSSACDESTEYGDIFVQNDATAGQMLWVCKSTGWNQQGGGTSGAALSALSPLTPAADKLAYYTGSSAAALTDLSTYMRGLLASANAAAVKTSLSLDQVANNPMCSNAQATAGAATNCNMSAANTAVAIAAAATTDQFQDNTSTVGDEFISGTSSTTTIGSLGWSLSNNGGAVTTAIFVNGDRNHPGIFRFGLQSGTVSGLNYLWLGPTAASPHYSGLQTTAGWEFRFRFRIPTTNQSALTEAGTQYWIGLGSTTGAFSATAVPTDGFFAHFTSGATGPWSLETWKAGSADAASQASTVGNLVLGTWYTVRIRSVTGSDGTVLISVNSGSGFETEKSFAVTSTQPLTPMFLVQSTAATASLPRQIDVDSFRVVESVVRY
jgi:hypothetical protein